MIKQDTINPRGCHFVNPLLFDEPPSPYNPVAVPPCQPSATDLKKHITRDVAAAYEDLDRRAACFLKLARAMADLVQALCTIARTFTDSPRFSREPAIRVHPDAVDQHAATCLAVEKWAAQNGFSCGASLSGEYGVIYTLIPRLKDDYTEAPRFFVTVGHVPSYGEVFPAVIHTTAPSAVTPI